MKIVTGTIALALFLVGGVAEAGWASGKRLPKPVDFPVVRPKVKEGHKPGNRQKHPPYYVQNVTSAAPSSVA